MYILIMTKRTDTHRPGAIIPAEYEYVFSYLIGQSWPLRNMRTNCEVDNRVDDYKVDTQSGQPVLVSSIPGKHSEAGNCCLAALRSNPNVKFAHVRDEEGSGKCTVCGAWFKAGDVWRHTPSGEYIHIGHNCADKYGLMADRSAFELERERIDRAAATWIQREQNSEERQAFLDKHPGLSEALQTNHRIVQDIASRFVTYRSLTEKQIELVWKLASEAFAPIYQRPVETLVAAPVGRVEFEGTIVKTDIYSGDWGDTWKMTVKVETSAGVWLAWGTIPREIMAVKRDAPLKGTRVKIKATLKPGRDKHFAIMSRPTGSISVTPES